MGPSPVTSSTSNRSELLPWLVMLAFGGVYAALAGYAFDAFPYSGDEYSTFLQAEGFARGVLHAAAPAHAALLRIDHVIISPWVCSKYPPGASALLALGVRAGVPWLVAPLESVVTLGLLYVTARHHGSLGSAWVTLLVLGFAPLFAFHAGTFFAHTPSLMWLMLAFAAVGAWTRAPRDRWLLLTGAALGLGFLTRPADAFFFGLALLVLRSPRAAVLTVLAVLPFFAVYLAYQAAQFGSPLTSGYTAYDATYRSIYGGHPGLPLSLENFLSPKAAFFHLDVLRGLVTEWTVPGSALLALLGAYAIGPWSRGRTPICAMRNVAVTFGVIVFAAFLWLNAEPDDGARTRFLSTELLPLAFLAGPGWFAAREMLAGKIGVRMTRAVAIVALVFGPVQMGAVLWLRLPFQWQREGLYRSVQKEGIRDGVVVVRAEYPTRYARNGMFFDGPVLYLSPPPDTTADDVARLFPGRPVYEAIEGDPWKLIQRK